MFAKLNNLVSPHQKKGKEKWIGIVSSKIKTQRQLLTKVVD
jgi:hypothetical protein